MNMLNFREFTLIVKPHLDKSTAVHILHALFCSQLIDTSSR